MSGAWLPSYLGSWEAFQSRRDVILVELNNVTENESRRRDDTNGEQTRPAQKNKCG